MKTLTTIFLMILALSGLTACSELDFSLSQQYRSADPGVSDEELFDMLEEIRGVSAANSSAGSLFDYFMDNFSETVDVVYFSEAGKNFGPPESVLSIVEGGFVYFDEDEEFSTFDIADNGVKIFYLEGVDDQDAVRSVLIIDYQYRDSEERKTIILENLRDLDISSTEYVAVMGDESGERLVLRSFDLNPDVNELAGVIQFKVSGLGELDDEEDYIGKFSTLVGFEP